MSVIRVLVICLLSLNATAQITNSDSAIVAADTVIKHADTSKVTIRNIFILGNKKTREYIIRREIPFTEGTTMEAGKLIPMLERARETVYNTQLFLEVKPQIKNWKDGYVDIAFEVRERWYLFPLPYFKLVDRNLNQWFVEQKASLKRVNYGLKFSLYNVSGRNDKLKVYIVSGYTRQYSFSYEQPFADKKLKNGFSIGFSFSQNRQVNHLTDFNKQIFFPESNDNNILGILKQQVKVDLGYSFRPDIYNRHNVRLSFFDEKVNDTIVKLNPDYFLNGKTRQTFPELAYNYSYTNVDTVAYPLRGVMLGFGLTQKGLGLSRGMNLWQLDVNAAKYIAVGKKDYFAFQLYGKLKVPFNQPYYNLRAIGYNDFYLQGLEDYVVDGVASAITKVTYRRKIFQTSVGTAIHKKGDYYRIPIKVYFKTYTNLGYSYLRNPVDNLLNNKLIYTEGVGLDIITFYDFQLKLEFSFNQLGQNGLFLHTQKDL